MKKVQFVLVAMVFTLALSACGKADSASDSQKGEETEQNENDRTDTAVEIKSSPDKYTWYIKDYTGKNAASFGYTSISGNRMDSYGAGAVRLVFVDREGTYIDINNEEELKKYVVKSQNLKPNSELEYTFMKDETGEEYDNLVESQTIEEIVLGVGKVGNSDDLEMSLTEIQTSPDKYTWYIRDYVGRNLAACGYLSISQELRDAYGAATVKFVVTPDDGSYIDVTDGETLKKYIVIGQNVTPNTEMKLEFLTDTDGEEYNSLIANQSIEEIELQVSLIQE